MRPALPEELLLAEVARVGFLDTDADALVDCRGRAREGIVHSRADVPFGGGTPRLARGRRRGGHLEEVAGAAARLQAYAVRGLDDIELHRLDGPHAKAL